MVILLLCVSFIDKTFNKYIYFISLQCFQLVDVGKEEDDLQIEVRFFKYWNII